MTDYAAALAAQFNLKKGQTEKLIELIDAGNTIPFIARYRKEEHGSLDDQTIRSVFDASPLAFAGSTIMLLTCSAEQVTADLASADWPERCSRPVLDVSWRLPVARQARRGHRRRRTAGAGFGDEPSRSLTHVQRRADDDSPTLGGAPTPAATRRRDDEGQRRAFIAWVG